MSAFMDSNEITMGTKIRTILVLVPAFVRKIFKIVRSEKGDCKMAAFIILLIVFYAPLRVILNLGKKYK